MGRKTAHISSRWRHVTAGVLCAILIALPGMLGPSFATTGDSERTTGVRFLVKAKKKPAKRVTGPAMVQDIRIIPRPDHTRLVFDLQRTVTFTQRRQKSRGSVVIEFHNAVLGKVAKSRLTHPNMPAEVVIAQAARGQGPAVTISLNVDALSDYKLLPLQNPDRLVIDLYGKIPLEEPPPTPVPQPIAGATSLPVPAESRVAREINTIVIDAGHGGKDPGAIGRNGTAEKDITLKVALILRDLLTKELAKQVFLTRDRDVFVELEDRAAFANKQGADLFVSIHVNSHPQRATKGLEIYHFGEASDPRALAVAARENAMPMETLNRGLQYILADLLTSKKMEDSLDLAWSTKQALVSHLGSHYETVDHGVKTGPFYVLRFTAMPSILAEIAFISNPTEERLMQGPSFLTHIAEGIFEGIKAFIGPVQTAAR